MTPKPTCLALQPTPRQDLGLVRGVWRGGGIHHPATVYRPHPPASASGRSLTRRCKPAASRVIYGTRIKILRQAEGAAQAGGQRHVRDLVFLIDLDNTILDNDGVKKDLEAAHAARSSATSSPRASGSCTRSSARSSTSSTSGSRCKRLEEEFPGQTPPSTRPRRRWRSGTSRPRLPERHRDACCTSRAWACPSSSPTATPSSSRRRSTSAASPRPSMAACSSSCTRRQLPAERASTSSRPSTTSSSTTSPASSCAARPRCGDRLTTVHVLQGKYALDPKHAVDYKPDIVVKNFSDLLQYSKEDFAKPRRGRGRIGSVGIDRNDQRRYRRRSSRPKIMKAGVCPATRRSKR